MYSIIIPHKNTASLLERLLDSIPWGLSPQVIVVDNNSNGEELQQVEMLRQRFDFLLCHSTGCGAGDARNIGLQHATGRWVLFADSDDFFTPSAADLISTHADDAAEVFVAAKDAHAIGRGEGWRRQHGHHDQSGDRCDQRP